MTDRKSSRPSPRGVRLQSDTPISSGYLKLRHVLFEHERFDGEWTDTLSREVMDRGAVAAVLPFDPVRQEVVLIEQFRIGAWAASWPQPWLIECIAGVVEPGETATDVVIREAYEEAGCRITTLEPIARYLSTPGACTEAVDLFCGRVDATGIGGIHGLPHEHEDIYASVWSLGDALDIMRNGEVNNSMTLIALQWLDKHHASLTRRWLSDTEATIKT